MTVSYIRKELRETLPVYKMITDCIMGQHRIKDREDAYLPRPNPDDKSMENLARYESYVERAMFYNVTKRTLAGMVGQIFSKEPTIELPPSLDPVNQDANGDGITLTQSAKKACALVTAHGRAGLLSDYPTTEGATTKAQLEAGDIRPTMTLYSADQIINWRTRARGAKEILSLIVLEEEYVSAVDDFENETEKQWRVLRLGPSYKNNLPGIINDPSIYTVEIWRNGEDGNLIHESYQPMDSTGALLKEIPFTFIGSENNDSEIDQAPMADISYVNIAHYRNSADYEESSFIVGQPTFLVSGMQKEWLDSVLNGKIMFGSRGGIPLPVGCSGELLQPNPNSMPFEAMGHKEQQMVALGAKLVQSQSFQKTATEASIESANENSVLMSISKNASDAYLFGLEKCALFTGDSADGIKFELNSDFDFQYMGFDDIIRVISMWQQNAISFTEMRNSLKRADVAVDDDEDAIKAINEEIDKKIERENAKNNNSVGD